MSHACRQMIFLMKALAEQQKEAQDLKAACDEATREHQRGSELSERLIRNLEKQVEERRAECEVCFEQQSRQGVSEGNHRLSAWPFVPARFSASCVKVCEARRSFQEATPKRFSGV